MAFPWKNVSLIVREYCRRRTRLRRTLRSIRCSSMRYRGSDCRRRMARRSWKVTTQRTKRPTWRHHRSARPRSPTQSTRWWRTKRTKTISSNRSHSPAITISTITSTSITWKTICIRNPTFTSRLVRRDSSPWISRIPTMPISSITSTSKSWDQNFPCSFHSACSRTTTSSIIRSSSSKFIFVRDREKRLFRSVLTLL